MLTRRIALKAALALPALAFIRPAPAQAAEHKVRMQSMQFSPSVLKIKVGDTVLFENRDAMEHTATAKDESWDTGNLRGGKSASIPFATAGEFEYICRWHGGMRGKIIVS